MNRPPNLRKLISDAEENVHRHGTDQARNWASEARAFLNRAGSTGRYLRAALLGAVLAAPLMVPSVQEHSIVEPVTDRARVVVAHIEDWAGADVSVESNELDEPLQELLNTSPTAQRYWETIENKPLYLTIGSRKDLYSGQIETVLGDDHVGEARTYTVGQHAMTRHMTVYVNLNWFDAQYGGLAKRLPQHREEIDAVRRKEIMSVLGHELGHAVEVARSHGMRHCEDPSEDNPTRGCSLNRENQIRAELGIPLNLSYGAERASDALVLHRLYRGQPVETLLQELVEIQPSWSAGTQLSRELAEAGVDVPETSARGRAKTSDHRTSVSTGSVAASTPLSKVRRRGQRRKQ